MLEHGSKLGGILIIGSGIDLCSIERMKRAMDRHSALPARLLSWRELSELGDTSRVTPEVVAKRFAAKEALIKALGGAQGFSFGEASVVHDELGSPSFVLSGRLLARVADNLRVHLSLSDEKTHAVAMVIIEHA